MHELRKHLPWRVKAGLLDVARRLGVWPLRIRAGPARGLVVYAPLDRWLQVAAATHEAHVAEVLCRHLKPAMMACDAGAHLGYFTVLMARQVGADGRISSFEPSPRHAGLLRRTVLRNGLSQVTVVEQALAAAVETGWLDVAPNDAMSRVQSGPVDGRKTAVSITTLDAWETGIGGLDRLDLIKLDVEGQELAALAGAAGVLERHRPTIVCEVHWRRGIDYRPRQLVDWLTEAGYLVTLIRPRDRPAARLEDLLRRTETAPPPERMTAFHVLATHRPARQPAAAIAGRAAAPGR